MNGSNGRKTVYAAFAAYTVVMLYLLFFQRLSAYDPIPYDEYVRLYTNFTPLRTLERFIYLLTDYRETAPHFAKTAFVNLLGNVLLFIPRGLFLPYIWRVQRHIWAFVPTAFAAISAIEAMQLVLRLGSCDVDDVILNMTGALAGFALSKIVRIKSEEE